MRVLWLLYEMGLDFELVIHPFDKSLRSKEYLAKHPVGRVPACEIDGQSFWESLAVMQILCERHPEAGLMPPPGDPQRADWLVWLNFAETISQHTAALTQQHVALYEDSMRSPIVMKLEAKRIEKCNAALDQRLAGSGDYILTTGFSAADIAVGQAVYMARHFARIEPFSVLSAWNDRITARETFRRSCPGPSDTRLYDRDFYEAWA